MQTIELYKYTRSDGGTTVSLIMPTGDYETMYRVIADEGMVLTDGVDYFECKDVTSTEGITEIEGSVGDDEMTAEEVAEELERIL